MLLYTSDWSGTRQVYAVRSAAARPTLAQLTTGRPARCTGGNPCGFHRVVPSPDGRRLLVWDYVTQGRWEWTLYLAAADGTARRRVGVSDDLFHTAAWSPDSKRFAYVTRKGVHVVRANGTGGRTLPLEGARDLGWSPDGHLAAGGGGRIVVWARDLRRVAVIVGSDVTWSRAGRWLAYVDAGGVVVSRPDGSGRRRFGSRTGGPIAWAPGDRFLAFHGTEGIVVAARAGGAPRIVARSGFYEWSPTRPELAIATDTELVLAGDTTRVLAPGRARAFAWAPDGTSLAYVACGLCRFPSWLDGDLRLVSRTGSVRTLVRTSEAAGGSIDDLRWYRPVRTTRFRPVTPRTVARATADGIEATRPIERIAADGDRLAYASCGHLFVWAPASGSVEEVGSESLEPNCSSATYNAGIGVGAIALAGDRVASVWAGGGNTTVWWLGTTSVASATTTTLVEGAATRGSALTPWRGQLASWPVGAGGLLAFSTWTERPDALDARTTSQSVRLAPAGGCPCPELASSPGPFVPHDVSGGRIVVGGDNETRLYDATGRQLLSVPVSPLAAQLDAGDLVVVVRGELRHFDAAGGALLHRWTLPDVPAGTACARLFCSRPPRLVLEDAARGLAAYTLDGAVHVVRLADGTDTTVAPGTAARFLDTGLVVLDGAELRLLPFGRLPQP